MSGTPPPAAPRDDDIPAALARPPRPLALQWVWLIPLLALLIGVVVGGRALLGGGPTITIRFATAEGLEPGKTRIKYKDVDIGEVKTVRLAPDGRGVEVSAEMAEGAQRLLVEDTRFWVVRARFAGSGVTGLSTLLSGAYIGIDAGKSSETAREFVGLDVQPGVTADEPGREFVLHAPDLGSIDVGAPVYYRRVQVGKVTATKLDTDGKGVTLRVFVGSPNERFVTGNTRFWHASGLDVQVDGGGLTLQTQSLLSIVLGGIAFGVPDTATPGEPAAAERQFVLFENQAQALRRSDAEMTPLVAHFAESVRGLAAGAQVDFRGIVVGEVRSVDVRWDREAREFRFPVELALYSDRLGSKVGAALAEEGVDAPALLRRSIADGLRAQLRTANLITGQRYVALDFYKDGARDRPRAPAADGAVLEIPTRPGALEDLQATLTNIAKKLDALPVEQIAADLRTALASLDTTLKKTDALIGRVDGSLGELMPTLQATVAETRATLRSANQALASDAPTQQQLREALSEVARAAQSLRELTDYLQRHPQSLLRGKPAEPASRP